MSTSQEQDRRLKSSQTRREVNLTWKADFWDFWSENKDDVDFIINSNIYAATLSPETSFAFRSNGTSPEDMYSDIMVKLHDSDCLRCFEERRLEREEAERKGVPSDQLPAFSELHTYLTSKVRGYVRHALRKVDRPYRYLGPDKETKATRVYAQELNGGDESLKVLPSNHSTDQRTILNEIVARVSKKLCRRDREILAKKLQEYTLDEIAAGVGCSKAFVGRILNAINDEARKTFNKPPRRVFYRKMPSTLKDQLAYILRRQGPMTLPDLYKEIAKFRPNSPTSSIRARIYGSIQKNEGLFNRLADGRYEAA